VPSHTDIFNVLGVFKLGIYHLDILFLPECWGLYLTLRSLLVLEGGQQAKKIACLSPPKTIHYMVAIRIFLVIRARIRVQQAL
jgi:hypothetical protein